MGKILRILFKNKKTLILVLGLGLFLSFIPLYSTYAVGWGDLFGGITNVGTYILTFPIRLVVFGITLALFIIALLMGVAFFIVTSLLNWIISASMQVPITPANPATAEVVNVVNIGWTFSRDFVNMLFILILVFIGLATILKIRDYEAKKLLPTLIIIAILINFSGVIMGFVVDMGNIVTNFFLRNTTVSNISDLWDTVWNYFLNSVVATFTKLGDPLTVLGTMLGILIYGLVILVFYAFATFVYFVIMLLFFSRVIILWILAILAPLAFACYILPTTRRFWNEWWQNLIQWSIIGVPIGFFLYLSSWIMQNVSTGGLFGSTPSITDLSGISGIGEIFNPIINLIINIFAPLLGLAFLGFGALLSIKLAPSGAQGIINFGKSVPGRLAGTRVGQRALGGLASGTQKILAGAAPFMKRLEQRAGGVPGVGKGLKIATAMGTRPVGWATRGISRLAGPALTQYAAEREKMSLPKDFEKWTAEKQKAWINTKHLDQNDLLVAGAKMGGNLEYAGPELNNRIKIARDAVYGIEAGKQYSDEDLLASKENLAYIEEAKTVSKTFPEVSEAVRIKMKIAGKKGYSRQSALNEIKKDIEDTATFIKNNIPGDDLTIEAGLQLDYITATGLKEKYITKEEVDAAGKDPVKRRELVENIKIKGLTTTKVEQFLKDIAAGATYIKDFKGGDIGKIADTKTLSTRAGIILGNPANLQRIIDEHGKGALDDVINGPGGLNAATSTFEKSKLFNEISPQMFRAIFTNPALGYIDCNARNQMIDPEGRPTNDFNVYERRLKIEKILDSSTPLKTFYNEIQTAKENMGEIDEAINKNQRLKREAERKGLTAEGRRIQGEITILTNQVGEQRDEIERKIDGLEPGLKGFWKEIEKLTTRRQGERQRGRQRRR